MLELNDVMSANKRGGSFYFKAIYEDLRMGDERDAIQMKTGLCIECSSQTLGKLLDKMCWLEQTN